MSPGDESDSEPMSTDLLEDIRDGSQSRPIINRREARYNIRDHIFLKQSECKGVLLSTRSMGKVIHKLFKSAVNELLKALPI